MRKVVASALLALLFGCSSEAPQVFQTPNWQRDAIIAAPGAKPLEVQEDVDAKGRKEWRYLYRPDGKPGFQIELDGDKRVEQVVIGYDVFDDDPKFEQDNATAKEMARKALAVLTGGDGREIDDLIAAGAGTQQKVQINGVEVAPYAGESMVMFTLRRPASTTTEALPSAKVTGAPTLGISAATIKEAVEGYDEDYQHGKWTNGAPTLNIKLRHQVQVDMIGDSDDLHVVSVTMPVGGDEDVLLKRIARLRAVLAAVCPEMLAMIEPAAWLQQRLAATVAQGKGKKHFAQYEDFGNKQVLYLADNVKQQIRITVAPKGLPQDMML